MKARPIVLHVHPGPSSFVVKDRRLMAHAFEVRDVPFPWRKKWQVPFMMVTQAIRLLFSRWHAVVVQFGGYHALLPSLIARATGRPCIIITGGTDCVSFPSLRYGNFAREPLGRITRMGYRWARLISPVHHSLVQAKNTYRLDDPAEQGLMVHMPDLRTPISVVHNGYAAASWPLSEVPRDIDVLSVALGERRPSTLVLKGIDMLIHAAKARPDLRFVVIGLSAPTTAELPANLTFLPPVPNASLLSYYQRTKVYAQLSLSEGFPNALCEAMLSGCVPLVSAVGAMPEIVGDAGVTVPVRDASLVIEQLDRALAMVNAPNARKARGRIETSYSEERRARELIDLIGSSLL
jgi:glycosyltransferase involved in cell wall biosynthesis